MKRSSVLLGIAIGSIVVVALLFLTKLIGFHIHDSAATHQQAWGRGVQYGPHGFRAQVREQNHVWLPAILSLLARFAVLIGGAALFFKGKGLLKWTGALFAILALMSLLTPLWGIAVAIVIAWIIRRIHHNEQWASAHFTSSPAYLTASKDRGQLLDEWERSQH